MEIDNREEEIDNREEDIKWGEQAEVEYQANPGNFIPYEEYRRKKMGQRDEDEKVNKEDK